MSKRAKEIEKTELKDIKLDKKGYYEAILQGLTEKKWELEIEKRHAGRLALAGKTEIQLGGQVYKLGEWQKKIEADLLTLSDKIDIVVDLISECKIV